MNGQLEPPELQSDFFSLTAPGLVALLEHGVAQGVAQSDFFSLTAPGLAAEALSLQQADLVSPTAPGLVAEALSLQHADEAAHLLLSAEHAALLSQALALEQPLTAPGAVVEEL